MLLVEQGLCSALLLLAVLGCGLRPARFARRSLRLPSATAAAVVPAAGLGIVGVATVLTGAAGLLGPWATIGLSAPGLLLLATDGHVASEIAQLARVTRGVAKRDPALVGATGAFLVLLLIASFAPALDVDEVEYHWPAAVDWASRGSFGNSPYRHVDGFPLMEMLYTLPATLHSLTGAHLLHLMCLGVLIAATAGICQSVGVGPPALIASAVLGMPVVVNQAYTAYNDVAAGAFCLLAIAVLLAGPHRSANAIASGLTLVVAVSIKPTSAVALALIAAVLVIEPSALRQQPIDLRRVWKPLAVIGGFVGFALAAWTLRRYWLTGSVSDPVLTGPQSTDALSRQADLLDKVLVPVMPFGLGIVGAASPWGGRIGPTLAVLLPLATAVAIFQRPPAARVFLLLALPAYAGWLTIGLATDTPRTRFSIAAWCLLLPAVAAIFFEDGQSRWRRPTWIGLILLGLVDNAFEAVRKIREIDFSAAHPNASVSVTVIMTLVATASLGWTRSARRPSSKRRR